MPSETGGTGGALKDPNVVALMEKIQQFRALLREKEAQGFDVSEFRQTGMDLMNAVRAGDSEGASRKVEDALMRLNRLTK